MIINDYDNVYDAYTYEYDYHDRDYDVQSNLSQRPPFNRDHLSIKTTTISSQSFQFLSIDPANKDHL